MQAKTENGSTTQNTNYEEMTPLFLQLTDHEADSTQYEQLRTQIIEICLPLAEHIARRFDGRGQAHDDLLQVARVGLVNAVDRFDPHWGSEFISFAVPTIMGEVRRHFRDTSWAVRVPRRMKELHLQIGNAIDQLSQQLGRSPTVSELTEALQLPEEEIKEGLIAGNAYRTVPMEQHSDENSGQISCIEIGDYDSMLEEVENHETLRALLEALSTRDRNIVMLRFFGNLTQTEIARKFNISQMHVSRILSKALLQLREQLGTDY